MNNEIQGRLGFYVEAFEAARKKVSDDHVAAVLVQEMAKDGRMAQIQRERQGSSNNVDEPATAKQIEYLKKLNVQVPAGVSKKQASEMIDDALAGEKEAY